jgi:riboflavin-specific deaminase-like protein
MKTVLQMPNPTSFQTEEHRFLNDTFVATDLKRFLPATAPTALQSSQRSNLDDDSQQIRSISNDINGITLKLAMDSNGAVADVSTTVSERFTCEASLDMVHRLRRDCDAVLVGRGTVEMDDCTLTVRRVPNPKHTQPTRVILDPGLRLEISRFKVATDGLPTIIVYALKDKMGEDGVKQGYSVAIHDDFSSVTLLGIAPINTNSSLTISAKTLIEILRSHFQIRHILVEGGPRTARQFLHEEMIDRAIVVEAPMAFANGMPSKINAITMQGAGLVQVSNYMLDVDSVTCYSRPNLPWPELKRLDLNEWDMNISSHSRWP